MVGDLAHVFNRGVEKRKIFLDKSDYFRFATNLIFLNNKNGKIKVRSKNPLHNLGKVLSKQKKLVEVLKWGLLPNHYHLLLYEVTDGGILEFTKRLGNAYTKYFNTKYKGRSGYLFQNSAKIVPINNDSQFLYIPLYIDLNCVDLFDSDWKNRKNNVPEKVFNFLKVYQWSSFKDYFGEGELEEIISKDLFYDLFDSSPIQYKKELMSFLKDPIGKNIELSNVAGWTNGK
ncbi:MAG: transposase [Minisyncoccota bacterium]